LNDANLSGTDLTYANLSEADLTHAVLFVTKLDDACGGDAKLPPDLALKPCPSTWPN
jgi:uncharacterized protein YjbI with pentapeptide repeats